MSRNIAHLTFTHYSEDGSVMSEPKCHTCMNRRFHEHDLNDVSMVYIPTLAGNIPFTIRSLIFSNGDEAPFTLPSISENLVVLECTDEFHRSSTDSFKKVFEMNTIAPIVPKKTVLKNLTVPSRKRNADEAGVIENNKRMKLSDVVSVDTASEELSERAKPVQSFLNSQMFTDNSASLMHSSSFSPEFSNVLSRCQDIFKDFNFVPNVNMYGAGTTVPSFESNTGRKEFNVTPQIRLSESTDAAQSQKSTECSEDPFISIPGSAPLFPHTILAIDTTGESSKHIDAAMDCTEETLAHSAASTDSLPMEQFSHFNQKEQIEKLISTEVDKCNSIVLDIVPDIKRCSDTHVKNAELISGTTTATCVETDQTVSASPSEQPSECNLMVEDLISNCHAEKSAVATKMNFKDISDVIKPVDASTDTTSKASTFDILPSKLVNVALSQKPSQCLQESDSEDVICLGAVNKKTTVSTRKSDELSDPDAEMPSSSHTFPKKTSYCNRKSVHLSEGDKQIDFPFLLGRRPTDVNDSLSMSQFQKSVQPFIAKLDSSVRLLLGHRFIPPEQKVRCKQCICRFKSKNGSVFEIIQHYFSSRHFTKVYAQGFVFSFSQDFKRLTEICKTIESPAEREANMSSDTVHIPFVLGNFNVKRKMLFESLFNKIMYLLDEEFLTATFESFAMREYSTFDNIARCPHCGDLPPPPNGRGHYFSHFLSIEHIVKSMENLYDFTKDWTAFRRLLKKYSKRINRPDIFDLICSELKIVESDKRYSSNNLIYASFAERLSFMKI